MQWIFSSFAFIQPIQWNILLLFGGLLLFGLIAGYIVEKSRWIPRITGYLLVGFILGDGGFNWLSGDLLNLTNIFTDIATALIIYQLGRYVDISWLKREKWLLVTVISSATLCFSFVSIALLWLGISKASALLSGIFSIATAPAVVFVLLRDLKAEGQVTRRLAVMTALNNFIAIFATCVILPFILSESKTQILRLFQSNLYLLCGSVVLAYLTYRLIIPMARFLGRQDNCQFVLAIAVIALVIGAAHALHLPVMLTMLIFAILSKNLDHKYDLIELEFGIANELFIIILFMTLGASIHFSDLSLIKLSVFILITARFIAMGIGIFLYSKFARMSYKQASLLTLGTLPMTEAGFSLVQTISSIYPRAMLDIIPLLVGCLIILELLGPLVTQFALIQSGESDRK